MRFTKAEAKRWEVAVSQAFSWAPDDEAADFFRDWIWVLWVFMMGEAKARRVWEMR